MRQRVASVSALTLALLGALAGATAAEPGPQGGQGATAKVTAIDAAKRRDKLDVYRDDSGHYVVVQREPTEDSGAWLFYGDGKSMYQQRVFGSSSGDGSQEFTVWAPRVTDQAGGDISLPGGASASKASISCGAKLQRPLVQLPADQARGFLARATFLPPLWQRQVHLLAREDDGTYYLVDQLRDEFGGGGQRLFVGKRAGGMKEVALTSVVSDPAGEVFTAKDGSIKTFGNTDKPPVWRHADKTTELTVLDVTDPATRLIVYRDFAIYGALGTPCD